MKLRRQFSKFFLRFFPLSWLLGVILPFLYSMLFINVGLVDKIVLKKKDKIIIFFGILFLFQVLSVIPSVFYDFFTFNRFIAIIHNISAFTFVILGYIIVFDVEVRVYLSKISFKLFYIISFWIFLGTLYSIITQEAFVIKTVPELFGVESSFFKAEFNRITWHYVSYFPRSKVLATYPNGTGLILLMIYFIYAYFNYDKLWYKKIVSLLVFVACVFSTGSRLYLVFSLALLLIFIIDSKKKLYFMLVFFTPIFFLYLVPEIEDLFFKIRHESNAQRIKIYLSSLELMINTNPITGLGIKPKIQELNVYPLGSHSTLIGYFVKCGVICGSLVLFVYLKTLFNYIKLMMNYAFGKLKFDNKKFFFSNFFIMIVLASLFEDFDAYELVPFLFGIVVWVYYKEILKDSKG